MEVRRSRPEDLEQVMELYRRCYWRDRCLLLNERFYEWQMAQAPEAAAQGGDQSIVAMDERGRMLVHFAVVPVRVQGGGRGVHMISVLSAPESRGRGAGQAVVRFILDHYDLGYGRSVTPAALAIYRKVGMRYLPECRRWIAVLDAAAALALADAPDAGSARRAEARQVARADVAFTRGATPPPGSAELAARALAGAVAFERSEPYLRWRYTAHPFHQHEFVSTGAGFAVVRVDDVSGRPGRVLRVLELLVPPEREADAVTLARAVFAHGRERGCAYVDAFGVSERFLAGFVAAGGFDGAEEPELRLPYLLRPWDAERRNPGLLFFATGGAARPAGGVGPIDDLSRVHVSRGDGNMDWPSWAEDEAGQSIAPPTHLHPSFRDP